MLSVMASSDWLMSLLVLVLAVLHNTQGKYFLTFYTGSVPMQPGSNLQIKITYYVGKSAKTNQDEGFKNIDTTNIFKRNSIDTFSVYNSDSDFFHTVNIKFTPKDASGTWRLNKVKVAGKNEDYEFQCNCLLSSTNSDRTLKRTLNGEWTTTDIHLPCEKKNPSCSCPAGDFKDPANPSITACEGTQDKVRYCTNPAPQNGGLLCLLQNGNRGKEEVFADNRACYIYCSGPPTEPPKDGVVDGLWGDWGPWTTCDATCGRGSHSRKRKCNNPAPKNNGKYCVGSPSHTEICDSGVECTVDGKWSLWGEWTKCTVTCGGGTRARTRECNKPPPSGKGKDCGAPSPQSQSQTCKTDSCPPIDGVWSQWTQWTACSVTCGGATQTRSRECNNPKPSNGGKDCGTPSGESRKCNTQACPVDGGWGQWLSWTACTVTCGGATQTRSRRCNNPEPSNGGKECDTASSKESRKCNTNDCPKVDGGWGQWAAWSTCTVTCDGATQTRTRKCDNPKPINGGKDCGTAAEESRQCNTKACPVNGNWGTWDKWSPCSVTCGPGTSARKRKCNAPAPSNDGKPCEGKDTGEQACKVKDCKTVVGQWGGWRGCDHCDSGNRRYRERSCTTPHPTATPICSTGSATDFTACQGLKCPIVINGGWSDWSTWGACTTDPGFCGQSRKRSCNKPIPQNGGTFCDGSSEEFKLCKTCGVDGGWGQWAAWSTCTVTCGGATQTRTRKCDSPKPNGGKNCGTAAEESRQCNTKGCPGSSTTPPGFVCPNKSDYYCRTGTVCISQSKVCDKKTDCPNGVDEDGCTGGATGDDKDLLYNVILPILITLIVLVVICIIILVVGCLLRRKNLKAARIKPLENNLNRPPSSTSSVASGPPPTMNGGSRTPLIPSTESAQQPKKPTSSPKDLDDAPYIIQLPDGEVYLPDNIS